MADLNVPNRALFRGDNLAFLRGINSETIDLVATDPPFNKGRDFHATPESLAAGASFHDRWSWADDIEGEWEDAIKDDWPTVWGAIESANGTWGKDMGAFLCYMGVRLLEMHRILKPTGSLYLHCDDTADSYLRMMLDAIFGGSNRRGQLIWERSAGRSDAKGFARVHDSVLYYAKSDEFTWHEQWDPLDKDYVNRLYVHSDDRGRYMTAPLRGGGLRGTVHSFEWRGLRSDAWRFTRERLEELDAQGLIHWPEEEGGVPRRKSYLKDSKGVAARDVITHISRATKKERTGYPTQKPIALYRRFIEASSNPGDVVLDPFCGCATTLIAAEQAGRNWIGIDLWEEALDIARARVEAECQNMFGGDVRYSEIPPQRTDDGMAAAPPLASKRRRRAPEPPGPKLTRAQMIELLIAEQDGLCAGCDRRYDDPRIWHLDHKQPRSEGGANHISNRALLCPPCNNVKGNTLTLTGLRKLNARNGWMAQ